MAFRRKMMRRPVRRVAAKRRYAKGRRAAPMKRAIKAVVQRLAETKRGEQYVEDKGLISAANVLFLNSIVPIGPPLTLVSRFCKGISKDSVSATKSGQCP